MMMLLLCCCSAPSASAVIQPSVILSRNDAVERRSVAIAERCLKVARAFKPWNPAPWEPSRSDVCVDGCGPPIGERRQTSLRDGPRIDQHRGLKAPATVSHRSAMRASPFNCIVTAERSGEAWAESNDLQYPAGSRGGANGGSSSCQRITRITRMAEVQLFIRVIRWPSLLASAHPLRSKTHRKLEVLRLRP